MIYNSESASITILLVDLLIPTVKQYGTTIKGGGGRLHLIGYSSKKYYWLYVGPYDVYGSLEGCRSGGYYSAPFIPYSGIVVRIHNTSTTIWF